LKPYHCVATGNPSTGYSTALYTFYCACPTLPKLIQFTTLNISLFESMDSSVDDDDEDNEM